MGGGRRREVARKALDVEGNFVFIATRRREETTHANNPPMNQTLNIQSHATEIKLQADNYKKTAKKIAKNYKIKDIIFLWPQ